MPSLSVPVDLTRWRWIVVNSSTGKDSQTALRAVVNECDRQGVPRSRVVISHQSLGKIEWPGVPELLQQHASHYGLRTIVTAYRNKQQEEISLLDYVRKRGKWPSLKARWCTSEFKRGPGGRVITQLWREAQGPILNVLGFRTEESPSRRRRLPYFNEPRFSSAAREVFTWLPIHGWSLDDVWKDIRASGVPYHWAYDIGMPRLSCRFCIFAPRAALLLSGRFNRELLDEYCEVERETGHSFTQKFSLGSIREAIIAGETPAPITEAWTM